MGVRHTSVHGVCLLFMNRSPPSTKLQPLQKTAHTLVKMCASLTDAWTASEVDGVPVSLNINLWPPQECLSAHICTHMHIPYTIIIIIFNCVCSHRMHFLDFQWFIKAPGYSLGLPKANIFSKEWAQGGSRWWSRETHGTGVATDLSTHGSFPLSSQGAETVSIF